MTRRLLHGARFRFALAALALPLSLAVSSESRAQQVVRCEGANGQVIYANSACPTGTQAVRTLEPPKAPSDNDRKAAQSRARVDAKEMSRIDSESKKAELKAERARTAAAAKANAKARECAKLERNVRYAKEDFDRAPLSKRETAQKKVRRAQDTLDLHCA